MKNKLNYILAFLSLAIVSCAKKYDETKLTETQKKMNVYKTGDSITFKEMNTGELYGFKVIESKVYSKRVQIFYPNYFPEKKAWQRLEFSEVYFLVNGKYNFEMKLTSPSDVHSNTDPYPILNSDVFCNKTKQFCYDFKYFSGINHFKDSTVKINEFTFDKVMETQSYSQNKTTCLFAENYGIVQIKDSTQNLILNIVNPVKLK
jgi:hypothetical protein